MTTASPLLSAVAAPAVLAPSSGIVEVFNYGRNKPGLIPLWVGEGDVPTPEFISEAAIRSMRDGETFYTYQRGIPELRQAIADYMTGVYGRDHSAERFFVTVGGMHALQIAVRVAADAGDEVIVLTPAWPNFAGAITVNGAKVRQVRLKLEAGAYGIDFAAIEAAIGPRTRAICINSPSNPTGWTATREEQQRLLELSRRHKLWIIADEIYGRFYYDGDLAPSFRDVMTDDDQVMFVQTFSKNWAMTGWRIGWLEAPPALGPVIENLVQYSTSGVPVPSQRAAVAALTHGEAFVKSQLQQARHNRDLLLGAFAGNNQLVITKPSGAFYLFFGVNGVPDSMKAAIQLIDDVSVGLAPGSAFGDGAEGFMRLCYLRNGQDIAEAAKRLSRGLAQLSNA